MEFEVHNKEAFEIPLGNVSHTTTSKNEVTLEFHQNDDAAVSLVEMRFHIPAEQNPEGDPVEVCAVVIVILKSDRWFEAHFVKRFEQDHP